MRLTDEVCQRVVTRLADDHSILHEVPVDRRSIFLALHAAECARRRGFVVLATTILESIERSPHAKCDDVQAAISCHRDRIQSGDASPLDKDLIAQPTEAPAEPDLEAAETLPPLLIRGWNFARSMFRFASSGFQMRSRAEIDDRLAICQECPHLVDDCCVMCGCPCVETEIVLNKLAIKTERCPIGKWS